MKIKSVTLFLISFKYAFSGILYCIKNERNFRFELVVLIFVLVFKGFYNLSNIQNMLLMITIAMALSAELFNTAIESTINLISEQYNKFAKIAKDTAAAAVLTTSIFAFAVGIYLFWDISVFKKIYIYFSGNIFLKISLIIILVISYLFVFKAFSKNSINKIKDVNNDN